MSLQSWKGRRKFLFFIGAIAIGGYSTYRIYTSETVSKKRKQIFGFLKNLSRLCEVVADGTESASLVCGDLRNFLLSEEDNIPRSIKQACKIMQCQEFQLGIASALKGILLGVVGGKVIKNINIVSKNNQEVTDKVFHIDHRTQNGCLSSEKHFQCPELDVGHDIETEFSGQMGCSFKQWSINGKESDIGTDNSVKPLRDNTNSGEAFLERLMEKLFSERGKNFVSVVVGSVARNVVGLALEVINRSRIIEHEKGGMTDRLDVEILDTNHSCSGPCKNKSSSSPNLQSLIDFASDAKSRTLIAECIEVFVATAVTVYLDKTKDVNVYEGLVAVLNRTSHEAPAKDFFGFICNGAVDTLVRTSHEVLSRRSGYENNSSVLQQIEQVKEHSPYAVNSGKSILKVDISNDDGKLCDSTRQLQSPTFSHGQNTSSVTGITVSTADLKGLLGSQRALPGIFSSTFESSKSNRKKDNKAIWLSQLNTSRATVTGQHNPDANSEFLSFVDGLSKALAIPNIRRLVIDVAGAITFQAVQSFFDVILALFKPTPVGKAREQGQAGTSSLHSLSCLRFNKVSHAARVIASNCLVALTLWLAVVMHVTSGILECV